ncbi:MAG: hypothetical protein P1U56_06380 [Saprospiraceae bacterium]|nr:hypothetical protein [Saprospiraceae bacterium]
MKRVLVFLFLGLLTMSCGSTKELETVEEEAPVEQIEEPKPVDMKRKVRKPSMDPEQLAAQLGLTEEQEKEFILMWNTTSQEMRRVRREYKDQKDVMLVNMRALKDQRAQELERILTDDQMKLYFEIMRSKRGKIDGIQRRGGE